MRPLTHEERKLISCFAGKLCRDEQMQLLHDLERCSVSQINSDGSRVIFHIDDYVRPPYRGQHLYGAEGVMLDDDGESLSVLLHADENGHLLELEFIRWDSANIVSPVWGTLRVS